MSTFNYAGYEQQRRNVETDYAAKQAAGDYGRFVAQQRGAGRTADLTRGFERGWGKQAAGWGARHSTGPNVNSGFYQRAMQDYLGQYQRDQNSLNMDLAGEQQGFNMQAAQLETEKQRALADMELQKQREIAALAANIQAIRPLV